MQSPIIHFFQQHSMNTQRELCFSLVLLQEKQGVIQISIYISNVFYFHLSPPPFPPFFYPFVQIRKGFISLCGRIWNTLLQSLNFVPQKLISFQNEIICSGKTFSTENNFPCIINFPIFFNQKKSLCHSVLQRKKKNVIVFSLFFFRSGSIRNVVHNFLLLLLLRVESFSAVLSPRA